MEFRTLGISEPILKALEDHHYTNPTPIQEKAIPAATAGRDILGLAQTGTGKTCAFAVPVLQQLSKNSSKQGKRPIRALVLTPTRELAIQIQESFAAYGKYLPLKSTVIFGGVGQGAQVTQLRNGVDILIATPGRLNDLINQGFIQLNQLEIFILDEADRMLDMGFIHDVKRILKLLPKQKQTMLFSATMPDEIEEIVNHLLVDPIKVAVNPVSSSVDAVEQRVYYVDKAHKIELFRDLFKQAKNRESVLIFTRTKHGADKVVKDLGKQNIRAQAIHGNKSQNARQTALKNFKNRDIQVLVATDIAARGIDISDLNYVVNYDLPEVPETYVHRIGRTGRAGQSGIAIAFCSFQDKPLLKDIEKLIKKKIDVYECADYPMEDFEPKQKKQQRSNAPKRKPANEGQAANKSKDMKPAVKSKPNNRKHTSSQKKPRRQSV